MDKLIYKALGHKWCFGEWSLIVHYESGKIDIITIPKKVYKALLSLRAAEEC